MNCKFSDLMEAAKVQRLNDLFYAATGIPGAVIDLDGTIVTCSGWQDVCTKFHRVNAETAQRCVESDTILANQIGVGQKFTLYQCGNGLLVASSPIAINGEHVANFITSQFLFHPPDRNSFIEQGRRFGFDEAAYMEAIGKIPIIDESKLQPFLEYFSELAAMLGEMAHKQLRQLEAAAALRESEQRWAITLSSIGDAVIATDKDGRITFMNAVAEGLSGWTLTEAAAKPIAEVFNIINERTRKSVDNPVAKVLQDGMIAGLANHTVLLSRDGREIPIDESAAPIRDAAGNTLGVVLVFRDITVGWRAEEELRRVKEEWELTFDSVPDMIAIIDAEHRTLRVNEAMARRLGRKVEECVGLRCYEAVHGLSAPPSFCPHSKSLKDGSQHIEEITEDRLGGCFLVSTTPLPTPAGQNTRTVHVARDITERKRAEEALLDSKAQMNRTQEIAHLGSWELDLMDNRLSWSDEVYRIFGLQPQEFHATYDAFLEAVHPEDREAVDAAYSGSLREGRDTYEIEHRIVRRSSGEIRIVHEKCEHFRDGTGRIVKSVGMVHDITERKTAENALREARDDLEQRVKERTAELRSLIEASLDPFVTINREGKISGVNAATELFTGFSRQELIGTDFADYFTDPEKARQGYVRVFAEESVRDYPLEIRNRNGEITPVLYNASVYKDDTGKVIGVFAAARDITRLKRAENELLSHLRFFQNMDRINQAMQGTNDIEQMMRDVLDAMLLIFESDRAWLVYPCDPDAASWRVVMERTKPEYPGGFALASDIPMNPGTRTRFQLIAAAHRVVTFGPEGDHPLAGEIPERFGHKSQISSALYPKTGKPWVLGMQQCSYPRVWTQDERKLLEEIARRMTDVLTSLLAHRDLRESEERHRVVLQTAMDGFFRTDMQGRFLEVNETYCRMSGYSEQELLTLAIADVEAVDTAEIITANIRRVEEIGPYRFESVHRRKDGSLFDVEIGAQYQPLAGGQAVVFVRDITTEKHAEEARSRLAAIVESSDDAIISKDLDGTITSWNEGAERLYGYSSAEALGSPITVLLPPNKQDEIAVFMRRIKEGVRIERYETERIRKDGRRINVSLTLSPMRDRRGKVFGASAIARDISDQKRAEEALRRSESVMAEAQRLSHTGSWVWDPIQRNFLYASEEMLRLYGFDPQKGIPTPAEVLERIHPEDRDKIKYTRTGEADVDFEYKYVLPDGTLKHFHCIAHPLSGPSGESQEVLGIATDITERKRAEEALQKLMVELELRVQERTKELSEANQLLQAANEELESYSYSVSHDLRAPLRAIDGFSRMVVKGYGDKLDDEGRRKLNVIRSNAQQMDQLINDLLAFSRLGRKEMVTTPLDMEALVRTAWKELILVNPEGRIRFSVQRLPPAMGDQTLIKEVVVNLLSNAFKFTKYCGKASIKVGAYPEEEKNVYYVNDNGVGFDMGYHDKLFGVFQRLHSAEEFEGTGVGLAIVERIVRRHGGRVWAEGKEGKGATFYFTLPRKE